MRPDRVRDRVHEGRRVLAGLPLALVMHAGHAQTQVPVQTYRIQPYIDLRSLVTDNVNNLPAGQKRKDMVNSVSPGLSVMTRSPMLQVNGDVQLTQLNYVRESQPDQLLPKGAMAAHLGAEQDHFGLDAAVDAAQTRASFTQTLNSNASTQDTYTDYRARIGPSWKQHFGPLTEFKAQAEHTWLASKGNSNQVSPRPDSQADTANLLMRRAPVPFGADLSGEAQRSVTSGQSEPALEREALRAGLSYAPMPELEFGLILGSEHTAVPLNSSTDAIRGGRIRFSPIERSQLDAQIESHSYGRTWQGAISHRNPGFSLSVQTVRSAETSTTSMGQATDGVSLRDALDAMLTSRISNPIERGQAVDKLIADRNLSTNGTSNRDLYDLSAQLKALTSARLALMGKHNLLSLTAGLSKSQSLVVGKPDVFRLLPSIVAKEYFADAQYTQDLSELCKWALGARWSKATVLSRNGGALTTAFTRELAWTTAADWRVSPSANLTLGLRRLTTHRDAQLTTVSNELYGGLGYRF